MEGVSTAMRAPYLLLAIIYCLLTLPAYTSEAPLPRPRSYPRVDYPERAYTTMDVSYCNFTFDRPVSATVEQETAFFDEAPLDPCWFDLRLDAALNGGIHFSYYPLTGYDDFERLRDQAFQLVGVHNQRASDVEEIVIHRAEADVHGIAFDIAGPAASPFQFFLTDSTEHFVRGALYFDTQVNPDSLAPVTAFVKEDIFRLVETFSWK